MRCSHCNAVIPAGDEYVKDYGGKAICGDCVEHYIWACYDIFDLARELGMDVKTHREETKEETEGPIKGQMDMFGGVVDA